MELHHQAVLERHARHLEEQVRLEAALVGPGRLALARLLKQHLGLVRGKPRRVGLEHGVVGGGGPHALEKRAPILERVHELSVVHERRAVLPAERLELGGPAGRRDPEHGVGAEAGDDLALPSGLADRAMMVE